MSVQVRPPSVVRGSFVARSATTLLAGGPERLAERSQAVLRDLEQLPVLLRGVDLRIGRAAVRGRERDERAAAVAARPSAAGQREQSREDGEHAAADR